MKGGQGKPEAAVSLKSEELPASFQARRLEKQKAFKADDGVF